MPINNRLTQYIILQKVQCICMYICTIKPILGHACLVSIATQVNLHLPYGRVRIGSSDHLVVSVSYTSILEKKEFSPLCPLNTQILLPMVVTPKILREKKNHFLVCFDNFTKEFTKYKIKPLETDKNVFGNFKISQKFSILCSLPMGFFFFAYRDRI